MTDNTIKCSNIQTPISLESQERLMAIMNDTPSLSKLANTEWEITALKPKVQYLIAEEAVKIEKIENANAGDVLKGMSINFASVIRVLTLALLNDKERIDKEYNTVYELLEWESEQKDWALLLSEILQKLDLGFFFLTTDVIQTFRTMTTERRMTSREAKLLSQGQNTGK